MGKGANIGEDRRDGGKEDVAGSGGAHRPDKAQPKREDGRDLRRHGVGRVGEVRADEDFKMPVRAEPVVPALADRLALAPALVKPIATRTREGRGASSASNGGAMPSATALSQLSRVSWVIVFTPFKSPVRRWPGHRPEHGRPRTPVGEGAAGVDGVERPQRSEARPVYSRCWGEGGGTSSPHGANIDAGARRHTAREIRERFSLPPCGSSPWAKTACGLGERERLEPRCRASGRRLIT